MKRKRSEISEVYYHYTGTDKEFTEFLKAILHDYLVVVSVSNKSAVSLVDSVESSKTA